MDTVTWLTPDERTERRKLRIRFVLIAAVAFAAGVNFAVWTVTLILR
jgi:hypothetical protein